MVRHGHRMVPGDPRFHRAAFVARAAAVVVFVAQVHLDARHDREGLEGEIFAWLPKIARFGWLSGDDYDAVKWPDVVAAVDALLPAARPWSTQQWRWERP